MPASPTTATRRPRPGPFAARAPLSARRAASRPISGSRRRRRRRACRDRTPAWRAAARFIHGRSRALPEDLLIELLGLALGFDAKLPMEHGQAVLVLPERGAPPPLLGVKPHQRAMHRLLKGVQGQELERRLERRLAGPHFRWWASSLARPSSASSRSRSRSLISHSSNGRLVHASRRGGPPGRAWTLSSAAGVPSATSRSKSATSTSTAAGFNATGSRPRAQRCGPAERSAEREQGLAQARPGRLLSDPTPQQSGELVARMRSPGGEREIGEQGLSLPAGQG